MGFVTGVVVGLAVAAAVAVVVVRRGLRSILERYW